MAWLLPSAGDDPPPWGTVRQAGGGSGGEVLTGVAGAQEPAVRLLPQGGNVLGRALHHGDDVLARVRQGNVHLPPQFAGRPNLGTRPPGAGGLPLFRVD